MRKVILTGIATALIAPMIAFAAPVTPPTCSITADKTVITRGETVNLTYSSTLGTKWRITKDGGSLNVGPSGTLVVKPNGTRPYFFSVTRVVPKVGGSFTQCGVMITVNDPVL